MFPRMINLNARDNGLDISLGRKRKYETIWIAITGPAGRELKFSIKSTRGDTKTALPSLNRDDFENRLSVFALSRFPHRRVLGPLNYCSGDLYANRNIYIHTRTHMYTRSRA